ncbi:MAG: hypothetical protein WA064_05140 [Candidatus Moraniibacteriota bacterium]|jgi:hypothetical protein
MDDELFDKIRNGSEEDAREAYKNMRKNSLKHAVIAIITRNLSHGLGRHLTKTPKKEV